MLNSIEKEIRPSVHSRQSDVTRSNSLR